MKCRTLSYGQIVTLCKKRGFKDPWLAAAVAMAESAGKTCASGTNTDGSIDRGLFMINSVNGSLSVFNLAKNLDSAYQISHGGTDWSAWVAYTNGNYAQFVDRGAKPLPAGLPGAAGGTGKGAVTPPTGGAIDSPEHRSAALKALVWVLFVLGGAGLALFGAARMVGLKAPAGAAPGPPGSGSAAPSEPASSTSTRSKSTKPATPKAPAPAPAGGVPF